MLFILGAIFETKKYRDSKVSRLSVGDAIVKSGRAMSWGHHPGSYGGTGSGQMTELQSRQSQISMGANMKNLKKTPNTLPLSMKPSYQSKENVIAEINRLDSLLGRRSKVKIYEEESEWR